MTSYSILAPWSGHVKYFNWWEWISLIDRFFFLKEQFLKEALTSFGVVCKTITHSIQSCLLYVPEKFQGLKTNKTWVASIFLRLFKTGNYICEIVVCGVVVRHQRMIYIHIIENMLDFEVVHQIYDKITRNLYRTKIAKQGGSMSVPSQNNKSIVPIAPLPLKESYAQK